MIYRQKARKPYKHKSVKKTKTNMKDRLRGFVFCTLWFLSIITGFFFLICPILPLVIISPKKYRRLSDIIYGFWEPFPVAIMEVCLGVKIVLSGDKINPYEKSLLVMNHRTRVDWNFLWLGLFHCCHPNAHNMKYVLKAPIMHIPGPGWVMQTCSFIFIQRNWNKDKQFLDKILDYLNDSDDLYQILLFPEGTDLSKDNIQKSHKYADEHNLERYYRVLHPRTTGFTFLARKMESAGGQLRAVYDLTIAYPKTMPENEADLFRGKFPEEVHFNVKRFSYFDIPHQENDLKIWLKNIWKEKEHKLEMFYSLGFFVNSDQEENDQKYSDEKSDLKKVTTKNGILKYNFNDLDQDFNSNKKELNGMLKESNFISNNFDFQNYNSLLPNGSHNYAQSQINTYKSKNYRPSHLLYLVLVFWMVFIIFTIYQFFINVYLQIWVLVHTLLFITLSFVSNGFQQVVASLFLFRQKKKHCLQKKIE